MIQQIRMKQVDALLRASNLTIAEIAERLGFHTAEYFSTAYKKRQGMSPSAYRAKMVSQLGCVDHAGPLEGSFWVVLDFFDKAFDQLVASHAWSDFTDDLRGNCGIVGL
ncbi:MAG: helix-turn-helix transcriptional regulator [Verrucomicrobiales bacterium]|nr:helix-turn-helix transcriptional regulator [Verrucomicrobiales bacterium]